MKDEDPWIEDVKIGECGNGYFVRIDGSDVFRFYPGRISFSIAEGLKTRRAAKSAALRR